MPKCSGGSAVKKVQGRALALGPGGRAPRFYCAAAAPASRAWAFLGIRSL